MNARKQVRSLPMKAIPARLWTLRLAGAFLVTLSVTVIFASRTNPHMTAQVRGLMQDVTTPVMAILTAPVNTAHDIGAWAHEMTNIRAENALLKQQNGQLMQWQTTALRLQAENDALRKLIPMVPDGSQHYIAARIIGETGGPFMKSALINAGSLNDVKADQAVITGDGLVGRVMETGIKSARVLLLTDMSSRVPVVSEKARERSILSGNNTPTLTLDYVPASSSLEIGERLLTSGDGGVFPPGIPVGIVTGIQDGKVIVQPLADWARLEIVSVIDYKF